MTIDDLIKSQDTISTAPQTACKLDRLLKRSSDLDEILDVTQYDPGLTARILQVCNSAAYRGRLPVSSLKEAILRLGNATLSRIVWQAAMAGQLATCLPAYRLGAGAIWRHSVTTAILAEELWKLSRFEEDQETAFTAGLLHDVGKTLIDRALSSSNEALFRSYIEDHQLQPERAETTLLGFNHAEVGASLLRKWELSSVLISGVAWHHNPLQADRPLFASLISLANSCAHHHEKVLAKHAEADSLAIEGAILTWAQLSLDEVKKALLSARSRQEEVEALVAIM